MSHWLTRALFGDQSDSALDFVPLSQSGKARKKLDAKLVEAKARHGREFRCNVIKPRETEPSRDLMDLNKASATAPHDATVTRLNKGERK